MEPKFIGKSQCWKRCSQGFRSRSVSRTSFHVTVGSSLISKLIKVSNRPCVLPCSRNVRYPLCSCQGRRGGSPCSFVQCMLASHSLVIGYLHAAFVITVHFKVNASGKLACKRPSFSPQLGCPNNFDQLGSWLHFFLLQSCPCLANFFLSHHLLPYPQFTHNL